ncbi:MAG: hypothetical protein Q9162_003223 [Coniocarpon cinnabarinum]
MDHMSDVPPTHSSSMPAPNGAAAGAQDDLANAKTSAINSRQVVMPQATSKSCEPDTFVAAQSTMASIQNSSTAQSLSNGPMAQGAKDQMAKTSSEFQNVADSRVTPSKPAATGQQLTHYHSMFYNILSWQNPRVSAVSFASVVTVILAARYLNILHYLFRTGFLLLAITASLEVAGKALLDNGIASRFRPKRYYTIPREVLESSLDDLEQFINFFMIESQRILFAENVPKTLAASGAALVSWGLIKIMPLWGLALVATCVVFVTPLVYVTNKEAIDDLLDRSSVAVNQQVNQLRELTAHHTNRATESMKTYAGEYSSKAQDLMARKGGSPLGPQKQEHTLKPSEVAGTAATSQLPTPPVTEPTNSQVAAAAPAVPKTEPSPVAAI